MSKEFIELKIGSNDISEARRQQKQLSYFTQSIIQQDLTTEYITQYSNRDYRGSDGFLNWVKMCFRTENFLTFFKYFRTPVASSKLINDIIKPQYKRVFFSEDAFFRYTINGENVEAPEELNTEEFDEWMFNAFLYRFNDILITDLRDTNEPFRQLISIDNVVALRSVRSVIKQVAFTATIPVQAADGSIEEKLGYLYLDDLNYIFYDQEFNIILSIPHDLGECPADYITKEPFSTNNDIVRKSKFSYIREEMEEYVFLKTLQRMSDPNGALPVVTMFKTKHKDKSNKDVKDGVNAIMSLNKIQGQHASQGKEVAGSESPLLAGTIIKADAKLKNDGSLDVDYVKNFLNFHRMPVDALEYVDNRIKDIKTDIVTTLLGDFKAQNESAKNELQISMGFTAKEDVLREISANLSRIRQRSDFKMLALAHGKDRVTNEAFFGSDFFVESQEELYALFLKAPNVIERKNILIKMTKNKNRFNPDKKDREIILYSLVPYVSDKDFDSAVNKNQIDPVNFQYYTRFNYWINQFEAAFGDILMFWNELESETNEKLKLINDLIIQIIEEDIKNNPLIVEPITTAIVPE